MEDAADGAADSFVLRSGVRAGLKREFAFAIASQAALSSSSAPLGRTRRSSRTLLSSSPASASTSTKPKPKRPRPPDPPAPGGGHAVGDQQQPGHVLALMAADPSPQPPTPQADAEADPARHTTVIIPPESSPRRITRSMLLHHKPPPPTAARNAAPLNPEPEQPPAEEEDDKPSPALRRFTRSLLHKDKDSNDDDLSGTTTASNASSPPPNTTTSISSNKGNTNKIPTNLRELLATGLLEGQPVKYIMRKGKGSVSGLISAGSTPGSYQTCWHIVLLLFMQRPKSEFSLPQNHHLAIPSLRVKPMYLELQVVSPYYFEVHAGSTKKHPSDYIFLENGNNLHDVLRACTDATLDMLESAIRSFSTLRSGKFALFCDSCLESKGAKNSTRSSKSARSPTSSAKGYKSASPGAKSVSVGRLTRKDKGLHKVVFMSGVLPEGTDVGYYVGGKRLLDGYIKELGIYCHCCNTVVSPSQFEAHAGRAARRKPYHNIYMSNGVSLHELSISLSKGQNMSNRQSDDLCSICSDGGQLLLCDTCPRAFHRECVSLFGTPKGSWSCRYCENRQQRESCLAYNNNAIAAGRIEGADPLEEIFTRSIRIATSPETGFGGCALCKLHDFSKKKFSTRTVLLCDQALPEGAWYCSNDCVRINKTLQDLLNRGGEPICTMDLDVIKKKREEKGLVENVDLDVRWRVLKDKSSEDSKLVLSKAVAIFHETFDPIIQITTGRDLIPAMVYGRSARDQDYTGMYCAVLTVRNTVVSAGLFRIMGSEIAELPLVATSRDSQGLGYFQALFTCIERLLASLEVKHFVLPAAQEAESIWTERFGFTKISQDELREYLKGGRTTVFQGTSTLHKLVPLPQRES
ncbi:Increased DNA methylation 1 [Dichanthelium oligosanthes]|uniref:Increased DNA methylation 1 n=1 Tax=Dichanthelium oligosanthes TaxID=888268 RepID=A0A1E5WBD6_9POAL|nr:Increased DNA methylation 1 [Dichanthelium oligosanthes]